MPPEISVRRGGRYLAVTLAPTLDAWTADVPFLASLHSGDIGWHLRLDDAELVDAFRVWSLDETAVAVGLVDDGVLRTAIAPASVGDPALAAAVAAELDGMAYVDTPSGGALRTHLLQRGWSVDPDPWVLLFKELGTADEEHADPDARPLEGEADVTARVDVQRSAFAPGSTFTPDRWAQMAAGPSYDPRFELLVRTPSGEPAAAATGWFAGLGRCAILEPVGTHRDHQRQGYGRRVNLAVMAALARAGACGIRVHTPASNRAAVAVYEACGLRRVDWTTALKAPSR